MTGHRAAKAKQLVNSAGAWHPDILPVVFRSQKQDLPTDYGVH